MLQRLVERFPAEGTDYYVVRVPRRLFDTDIDLGKIDAAAECAALLANAELPKDNRYLPLKPPD